VAPPTTNLPRPTERTTTAPPRERARTNAAAPRLQPQQANRLEEVEPSPPPTIFPNATQPSNANDRTSPPAGVLLPNLPPRSNDAIVHPPRMRANQGRAQRERGFVYPGAYQQGPLRRQGQERECGSSTSKGGGARSAVEDGGGSIRLPPTPDHLRGHRECRPPYRRRRTTPARRGWRWM